MLEITQNQMDILSHTFHEAANRFYCGDSEDMQALVQLGLMRSAGRKSFVPEEYFTITALGKKFLGE